MKKSEKNLLILTLLFTFNLSTLWACSLALHKWQILFVKNIHLDGLVMPFCEISQMEKKAETVNISQVIWLNKFNFISKLALYLFKCSNYALARLPWKLTNNKTGVMQIARKYFKTDLTSLIVSIDKVIFNIALFKDLNSHNSCYQLVFMQQSRMRAVIASSSNPWAKESNCESWISIIFYKYPLPGNIISIAVFPIKQKRVSIIDNHNFVEKLLAEGILKRRGDLELDPQAKDFPNFSE